MYGKYREHEVWLTLETHTVTWEAVFRARSKKQPLGEQMNLPVREAQSATSSLPYGNGYALGKFTSFLLSICLPRSTDPFTRLSVIFHTRLFLTFSCARLLSTLSRHPLAKSQVVQAALVSAVSHIASFLFALKISQGNASPIRIDLEIDL